MILDALKTTALFPISEGLFPIQPRRPKILTFVMQRMVAATGRASHRKRIGLNQ
jgi:hypothetical protein